MFHNTKCECGHQNHAGTVLCESCGKPLDAELAGDNAPLEMRYDGAARRSQKANPGLIDRVWNFFSSVKIAVILIVITLLGAMLGTIYPQEGTFINFNDPEYYEDTYGLPGKIYYMLGLSHTYESWWFIGLLVMIGTSLVICSLDRVLPLYKALNKQQIRKHLQFITRQKVVYTGRIDDADTEEWTVRLGEQLRKRNYKVYRDGDALLAEKNRFSRWGPYINHIGLILFLLAVLARSIPGWHMDTYAVVPEGDTVRLADTNYYLKNVEFSVDYYSNEELPEELRDTVRAKKYQTKAELYECVDNCAGTQGEPVLEKVTEHDIIVNSPLSYKGLKAYQFDYDPTPKLKAVNPMLVDKKTGEAYGPFHLSITEPEMLYELGPYRLELITRFMDFTINEQGKPATKSREPNAPAFLFLVKGPELDPAGETFIYFPKQVDKQRFSQDILNRELAERIEFRVDSMEEVEISGATTYLNIRIDKAMPYIWVGAAISMIGLVMGFYWNHRRIWLRIDNGILSLGAHTNKNWYGMRNDVAAVLRRMGIELDPKSLDNGGNKT
ncbi:cytochrome c biogenesis protein ResB [Paenibacillus sambharensis]|uniref:Cytochrome c biogenesis protein ResB n=1 Tax=Paenibacillus sambharensis TaxID=1803190 RepID=A0A2W1L3N8_9BACL|nr:cytochrome c biogenesis protein ResB [Paenibacillus sambharensis]PZD93489.1 cytochrome c biogenesis protein ResB [Paenibacillus sambharensis]